MNAPQFSLPDQMNSQHSLSQYLGQWVVLYFYPKDDTTGCTKEACSLQDTLAVLRQKNVVVLGVSQDSVESHKKFAEKYHLTFPLLSDTNKEAITAYHAWGVKKFAGREYTGILRQTFLIDPTGDIVKEYKNVNPTIHAEQIVTDLNSLQSS